MRHRKVLLNHERFLAMMLSSLSDPGGRDAETPLSAQSSFSFAGKIGRAGDAAKSTFVLRADMTFVGMIVWSESPI
jgi:hypothetical protein